MIKNTATTSFDNGGRSTTPDDRLPSDGDRPVMNDIDDDRDELAFAKLDPAHYVNM
jgi:hypothetical protein